MNEEEKKVPEILFLNENRKNHKLQAHIDWHETFIDYIKKENFEIYKAGVKYTDDLRDNGYFTKEEIDKMK
jgi:hypothetical protein